MVPTKVPELLLDIHLFTLLLNLVTSNCTNIFSQKHFSQYCQQWIALHSAAVGGHIQICKFTMTKIVEKNPRRESDGITPLHIAAGRGQIELYKVLMKDNRIVNPRNNSGSTPLHYTAQKGHLEVYELISKGSQVRNPIDIFGRTPLHYAAQHGYLFICQFILENTIVKNPQSLTKKRFFILLQPLVTEKFVIYFLSILASLRDMVQKVRKTLMKTLSFIVLQIMVISLCVG